MSLLLAGDIGGTKTALAIFSSEAGPRAPLVEAVFHSADYPSLEAVVRKFLAQAQLSVDRASFGVAGPVVAGRAVLTNLPWVLDEAHLQRALGLPAVRLLNDLEAMATAAPLLEATDLRTLQVGEVVPKGAIAVIAPGTALGEAFLTWDGSQYRAHPSEGGHTDFAPTSALEFGLLEYLKLRYDHVSYERVCSGLGLPHIYAYLKDHHQGVEPVWLTKQLQNADDPTPVIIGAALGEVRCDICVETLNLFMSILGAEAGNLVLKVLATGGIYVGGGIPPRILGALERGPFLETFQRKGRHADLLRRVPVHVMLNPKVGLLGAARHGLTT